MAPPRIFDDIFKYTDWPVKILGTPHFKEEVEIKFKPETELAAVRWFGKHRHMIGKSKFRVMFLYEDSSGWVLASIVRKVQTDNEGA